MAAKYDERAVWCFYGLSQQWVQNVEVPPGKTLTMMPRKIPEIAKIFRSRGGARQ